jgi:hypothetical protein
MNSELYRLEKQLDVISTGINSTRPLKERVSCLLKLTKPVIKPTDILDVIDRNYDILFNGGRACGAGYFIERVGSNYIVKAYTKEQFLSLDLGNVMAKRSPLPETQNQWKIPIEQIDPYLK